MTYRYHAHGLTITSEVELALPPAPPAAPVPRPPDLVLGRGAERVVPDAQPPGTPLAMMRRPDGTLRYGIGQDRHRTVLRYPGLCDFVGDAHLREVTVHPHPGADPGLPSVLASGALLAVHLKLRHELVLHASAVQLGAGAVAFVGASGMGKSTLAALLCAHGGAIVSDDVLRVDRSDGMRVYPGSAESRLRPAARQLADTAYRDAVRTTADGRLAVRPRDRAAAPLPLLACVVPLPTRRCPDVTVTRLGTARALLRMLQFPRVVGWCEPLSTAAEFQALADLVDQVAVFDASVPWGPPFRPEVAAALVEAVAGVPQR
jgi:hypothetical protein